MGTLVSYIHISNGFYLCCILINDKNVNIMFVSLGITARYIAPKKAKVMEQAKLKKV